MLRVLPVVILLALTVYCTVDLAQSEYYEIRGMPKWLWALVVVFLPGVGPVLWLALGRPLHTNDAGGPPHPPADLPPDDNPDFLRTLR